MDEGCTPHELDPFATTALSHPSVCDLEIYNQAAEITYRLAQVLLQDMVQLRNNTGIVNPNLTRVPLSEIINHKFQAAGPDVISID